MVPDCFLIDLDGTMYIGNHLIDGAERFVEWLLTSGKRFRFITNNSSNAASHYVAKLRRLGVVCPDNAVFTSTKATIQYLREKEIQAVFPLGTPSFVEELLVAGITVNDDADCVLLGFDKTLTYQKANHAFQLLQRGAEFIATHPDVLCPIEGGYSLDCGAILAMFEHACRRKATILGKPSPEMVNLALREFNAKPSEALVIGDRVYTDMRMGIEAGTKTALVLSGETKSIDALPFAVDYVVSDIGQLPYAIEHGYADPARASLG